MTIVIAITTTMLQAKLFKDDLNLSLLLGIGTGVCGAPAIAAVSPILKANDEDTAIGAGIIALIGTVFSLILSLWMKRKGESAGNQSARCSWFLLGFIMTSLVGTYLPIPDFVLNDISKASSFLLASAMVGFGLSRKTVS